MTKMTRTKLVLVKTNAKHARKRVRAAVANGELRGHGSERIRGPSKGRGFRLDSAMRSRVQIGPRDASILYTPAATLLATMIARSS